MKTSKAVLIFFGLFTLAIAQAASDGFPGRAKYPEVAVIEKAELAKQLGKVVVVDTRSSLEFDTLRIKGAINLPVASKQFEQNIQSLRSRTEKPIVFYCNGRTCMKSYIAVKKASKAGVANTVAYDAGMFEWAKSYPEQAELLGHSPVETADIISKETLQKRFLEPNAFLAQAHELDADSMVIDVRDKFQRSAAGLFPGKEIWASLDNKAKLHKLIQTAKQENKTLFIYDEVGKQVRWLQYALEKAQVKDYYFMQRGAKGYYAQMMKEFGINSSRLQ